MPACLTSQYTVTCLILYKVFYQIFKLASRPHEGRCEGRGTRAGGSTWGALPDAEPTP